MCHDRSVEPEPIRRELEAARAEARRLAAEQQAWRAHISELYERARLAGIPSDEIVDTLGLSVQWAKSRAAHDRLRRTFFS
jgi:hypothetical protein